MNCLKKVLACAGVAATACIAETAYFYNKAMKRSNVKKERTIKMSGANWEQHMPLIRERKNFMMQQAHEDVYRTSFDGLKLHATFFPALPQYVTEDTRNLL